VTRPDDREPRRLTPGGPHPTETDLDATATARDIDPSEPDAIVERHDSRIVDRRKPLEDQSYQMRGSGPGA